MILLIFNNQFSLTLLFNSWWLNFNLLDAWLSDSFLAAMGQADDANGPGNLIGKSEHPSHKWQHGTPLRHRCLSQEPTHGVHARWCNCFSLFQRTLLRVFLVSLLTCLPDFREKEELPSQSVLSVDNVHKCITSVHSHTTFMHLFLLLGHNRGFVWRPWWPYRKNSETLFAQKTWLPSKPYIAEFLTW